MPFASHSEYVNADDEDPIKIKGIAVHVSPVDEDTVCYVLHNGNRGYYIYAQNSLVFPVELGKVYEVGGFKKNYRGLCEIVDVEYVKGLDFSVKENLNPGELSWRSNIWGKVKTVSQMLFSIIIMIALHLNVSGTFEINNIALISNILLSITAVLTVISGVKYIVDGKKVIDFSM